MIDFAKLRLNGRRHRHYRQALRSHPLLNWTRVLHNVDHPPKGCTMVARWNWWTFYADGEEVIEIRGSFHKNAHDGANWKDFTHARFIAVVNELCDTFRLFPGALRLLNLEVGVNIVPSRPTVEVLDRILFHRTTSPARMKSPAIGIVIAYVGYSRFKIYDKAHEYRGTPHGYGMPSELLRFEIHVDRMAMLHDIGIRTVHDLLDPSAWDRMGSFLLRKFDELFIVGDEINPAVVTRQQAALLANAGDLSYWMGLSPNKRNRKRGRVERLWRLHCRPCLKDDLRDRIAAKVDTLTADRYEGGTFDTTRAHVRPNIGVILHPQQAIAADTAMNETSSKVDEIEPAEADGTSVKQGAEDVALGASSPSPILCAPLRWYGTGSVQVGPTFTKVVTTGNRPDGITTG